MKCRYIHLPGSLNVADRLEAKQREIAKAKKEHALALGRQAALPKGQDAFPSQNLSEDKDDVTSDADDVMMDPAESEVHDFPELAAAASGAAAPGIYAEGT